MDNWTDKFFSRANENKTDNYALESKNYDNDKFSNVMVVHIEVDTPVSLKNVCQMIIDDSDKVNVSNISINRKGRYYGN